MARPRSRVRPLEASGNRRPREMTVAPDGAQNPAYSPSLARFLPFCAFSYFLAGSMTPVRVFTLERQKDFLSRRSSTTSAMTWSEAYRCRDALSTLRFRTYDAGIVSPETVRVLLYGMTTSAPWLVREASPPAPRPPRLLDRVREAIRSRHYSRRTEKAYVHWIRRFIFFHGKRHPAEMGAAEVAAFLTSLAVQDKVAASTQNQAQRPPLSVSRGVWRGPAVARGCRARQAPAIPAGGPDPRRDPRPPPETERRATDHGTPAIRRGPPPAGVLQAACEGCRLRGRPDRDS